MRADIQEGMHLAVHVANLQRYAQKIERLEIAVVRQLGRDADQVPGRQKKLFQFAVVLFARTILVRSERILELFAMDKHAIRPVVM